MIHGRGNAHASEACAATEGINVDCFQRLRQGEIIEIDASLERFYANLGKGAGESDVTQVSAVHKGFFSDCYHTFRYHKVVGRNIVHIKAFGIIKRVAGVVITSILNIAPCGNIGDFNLCQ